MFAEIILLACSLQGLHELPDSRALVTLFSVLSLKGSKSNCQGRVNDKFHFNRLEIEEKLSRTKREMKRC